MSAGGPLGLAQPAARGASVRSPFLRRTREDGERDVSSQRSLAWQQGPRRRVEPGETDLESVIVHELGHIAGNPHVSSGCANSPMIPGLDRGENCRDRDQMGFWACGSGS
jgi:hypothetical protein